MKTIKHFMQEIQVWMIQVMAFQLSSLKEALHAQHALKSETTDYENAQA